ESVRFGTALHPRARFCTEVLNDDFLDVSVLFVQLPDRDQTIDALLERLTDSDKNPGGKSDRKLTGLANHPQPYGGQLIGCGKVRHTPFGKPGADVFQHQAEAGRSEE